MANAALPDEQPNPSHALIDGAEISELELLRYQAKRAQIAAFCSTKRSVRRTSENC
jgi:hypothetical protein